MIEAPTAHVTLPIEGGDARQLQLRLYREIGLLAVAAALESFKPSAPQPPLVETPVAPEGGKRAA